MRTVKMGFVGAGFMGQLAHIANYAQINGCQLVALAEGRHELARKVAERYHIERVYPSHRELADDPDIEAVVAVLPYALNYPVVADLLAAGKHVLTEKPMANSVEEADELIALAEANKVHYEVGYMKRHDTGVDLAKGVIEDFTTSQCFGPVQMARAWCFGGDWTYGIGDPVQTDEPVPDYGYHGEGPPKWMSPEQCQLFERLLNIDSHLTNLLRYLAGEDYSIDNIDWRPERPFVMSGWSGSGVHCLFEGGDLPAPRWYEGIEFYFTEAVVRIIPPPPMARQTRAEVTIYEMGSSPQLRHPIAHPSWAFLEQAKYFLKLVRGEVPPRCPASEAAKEVKLAEAVVAKLG